jgi:hypothetical protein
MRICPDELAGISKQLPAIPQVGNFNENEKIDFIL